MIFRMGGRAAQVSRGSRLLIHTVRAAHRRGKRPAGQLDQSPCKGATQVILWVSVMTTGKIRAAATKQICNGSHGCPSSQQLFGDPLVGDTPIGVRESLWNPQPLQPSLVDVRGLRGSTGCGDHHLPGETRQRSSSRYGAGDAPYLALGGLYQQSTLGRQTNPRVQQSHPGSVPVALAPEGFPVGEPSQSSQMTPVCAGQVASVRVRQRS